MRRMQWGRCGLLLAIGVMLVEPATASAAWTRPARIGPLVEHPFRIAVASARQVTAVTHASEGRNQGNAVVSEVWLDLRRGAKFLPREKVATTSRFLPEAIPAVASDGTVAVGYTSVWVDPADAVGSESLTLSFRVRSPSGAWSAEQQARIPTARFSGLGGRMVATRSGFVAIWQAETETGTLLVTARYARATGTWTFVSEEMEPLQSIALGPDGSVGVIWISNARTAVRVRSADGRWGPVLRLTGHDRVPHADGPRITGLGSSRFAVWTCVSPKASVDCNPVRLAIVGRSSVLRTITIRPRGTQGFRIASSIFGFGDQLDVVPDRGQALVIWTQRSSRGRKRERDVRTIRVGVASRKTPASKLLGRMTKTAVIDAGTAPDGRAVALVTGAISSCKAGVSGEARYAAAAVRTHGRWGGLRRIACDGSVEGMRVTGTARGFLATWMRAVTTTAGFRSAVTVSTYR